MPTVIDIPESTLRRAEQASAQLGFTVPEFIAEAVEEKAEQVYPLDPLVEKTFGRFKHLRKETARIQRLIEEEFGPQSIKKAS